MHSLESNETLEEKARLELLKEDAYCFEQILGATPYNTAAPSLKQFK